MRRLVVGLVLVGCVHQPARERPARSPAVPARDTPAPAKETPPARVDFTRDVQPIFESRCQPCHFPGGRMYESLPFDRSETIRKLGHRVLTRIKAPDEQTVIRGFLSQPD